jgi:hypothetical protein
MRLLSTIILVTLSGFAAKSADWITTDGKTYKNVKILKHDASTVTILDADGGASVPLEKLPGDLQKKFQYDLTKARAEVAARHNAQSVQMAALELSAALAKKDDALSKSATLLIGTIVGSRSDGYFVAVYAKSHSPMLTHYFGSHPRSHESDHAPYTPPNAIGTGTYFLKTRNTFQQGQLLGLIVYPCGSIPDLPYRPIKVFTNELEPPAEKATAKPSTLPPLAPNNVAARPAAKAIDFNPGSLKDDLIDNSATAHPAKTDQFNPGSMDDDILD